MVAAGRGARQPSGSAGGHNGLKSIFRETGTQDFPRVRIGIGRPRSAGGQAISHVLARFSPEEQAELEQTISTATDTVEMWCEKGITETMNAVNGMQSGV